MAKKRSSGRAPGGKPAQGREVSVGFGAAFAAVVLVLVALAGGWWFAHRSEAPPATTAAATAPAGTQAPTAGAQTSGGGGVTPEGDPFLGSPTAPVTIVEYADFKCPNCRQFATEVLPWLKDSWMAQGMVRVVFRDFAIRGEGSQRAAEAAHCAGDQGQYWAFHDRVFEAQTGPDDPTTREALVALADDLGLDKKTFTACLDGGTYAAKVKASTAAATAKGFEGTPTFEINGRVTSGAIPVDRWNELFLAFQSDMGRAP